MKRKKAFATMCSVMVIIHFAENVFSFTSNLGLGFTSMKYHVYILC